ncbi:MAG TPA: efflux transporter outer membrane subunit [Steroidobacteraceae bacterium]|jgi:NodT family efflux transporter outer membrane factor (OMF) lipoprotein|nr:efflux transporter outer membrane subunit [Steroidobacteraceae bacterium]
MQVPWPSSLDTQPALSTARASVTLALFATLAGCVVGPDYHAPQLALPSSYAHAAPPATVPSSPAAPTTGLNRWWEEFNDPELSRIIRRTQQQNLDLEAALARVREARANARESGARLWPEGALQAGVLREEQSVEGPIGTIAHALPGYSRQQTVYDLSAGVNWEADLFGGQRRSAEAAVADAQASAAQREAVRVTVTAEAADAYFQMRGAQARLQVNEAQVDLDRQLLTLVLRRQSDGVATDLEVNEARALLAHARATLPPLIELREAQLDRLQVLMGVPPGADSDELRCAASPLVVPSMIIAEGPRELLQRRPDVLAAERRLAASNARIGVAIAQYYPTISLSALSGFESMGSIPRLGTASYQPLVLAGLHWRLFDFGRIDAQVDRMRGANAEALAQFRQSILAATEDVEDAIVSDVQLREQYRQLQEEVTADAAARAAAQQQYLAGAVSLLQVLDTDRQLLAARDALIATQIDEARAAVATYRALGGGWTAPSQDR